MTRGSEHQPIAILLVDDNARVRSAIRETLQLEADLVLVGEATTVDAARVLAAALTPSVALVEVLIPDLESGLALVRSLSRDLDCRVVAMSMRGTARDVVLAAGAAAFVEKGEDIEALLSTLRAAARPPSG